MLITIEMKIKQIKKQRLDRVENQNENNIFIGCYALFCFYFCKLAEVCDEMSKYSIKYSMVFYLFRLPNTV